MSLLSLFSRRVLLLTVLLTLAGCLSNSITIYSQSIHEREKYNFGAIDPLLYDAGNQPWNNSLRSLPTNSVNKTETAVRTASELDPSLNAIIDSSPGNVRITVLQQDGKILVGGYFKTFNGVNSKGIVRLNADNSIDQTFRANVNGTVLAIAIQQNGKIVIGGAFTVVNGVNQNRITRLNADGSLDTSFNTVVGINSLIYDIAIQPDGKILIGGTITGTSTGTTIVRLNTDGSLDTSFVTSIQPSASNVPPSIVFCMALQPDGKILVGGFIILSSGFPLPTPITTRLTRLNADGTFDSSFNSGNINSDIYKIALQSDGKILIGGFFNSINEVSRGCIARLNADGSLDTTFNPGSGANVPVYSVLSQADGKVLIGGTFTSVNGVARNRVARLNADGSLDNTFVPGGNPVGSVYSVMLTPNGKVFAGGSFILIPGLSRDSIAVFDSNGALDNSANFNSTAVGGVRAVVTQPDGKIIIGGNFNRINGVTRNRLARLNPDGTIDDTFNTSSISPGQVTALLLQPDGKILVGGTPIGVVGAFPNIVRLNTDGTLDSSFNQTDLLPIRSISAIALQTDGKILFSYIGPSLGGGLAGAMSRLNANGSLDSSFVSGIGAPFEAIIPLPDGKILAGGPFYMSYVSTGQPNDSYYGVFRLNSDGSHDRNFRAGFFSDITTPYFTTVYTLALQADGKILVGGNLFTSNGATPAGVARLNASGTVDESFQRNAISSTSESARVEDLQLLPNGKIVIGGRFNTFGTSAMNNAARLNADGSLDNTFNVSADNTVFDVALQPNGKIIIGGDFDTVDGFARSSLARLLGEPITQRRTNFDFDGDGKSDISIFRPNAGEWWYQRSSDGQVPAAQFGTSTDKLVPADYTGDGKTDIAYWKPSTGEWYVLRSENNTYYAFPFGASGDIPVPADYDGDGRADAAVFRPSNATWYINKSTGGVMIQQFGASGDIPVVADYDGDGKADMAIYRPVGANGSAEWWMFRSSDNGVFSTPFGASSDKPVPADYTGDGKADVAFWRPSTGEWFVLRSENLTYFAVPFGSTGDIPAPGDYDGDGKSDPAVFRPSGATWFVLKSTGGTMIQGFGSNGDIPVPSAFIP